jgi:hypothetical protein
MDDVGDVAVMMSALRAATCSSGSASLARAGVAATAHPDDRKQMAASALAQSE